MRHHTAVVMAGVTILFSQMVAAEDSKPAQAQLLAVATEAKQLKAANPDGLKGKLAALIAKAESVELGPIASAQEKVMKLSLLAELQSSNGDFDISNDNYRKSYALMPTFEFYRKMVLNMRLKGDEDKARAVVEEYRKLVENDFPGEKNMPRRQDMVQFVETALTENLP